MLSTFQCSLENGYCSLNGLLLQAEGLLVALNSSRCPLDWVRIMPGFNEFIPLLYSEVEALVILN